MAKLKHVLCLHVNKNAHIHSECHGFLQFFSLLTRKRAREEEIEAAEKAKREREWQKNFEVRSSPYWSPLISIKT